MEQQNEVEGASTQTAQGDGSLLPLTWRNSNGVDSPPPIGSRVKVVAATGVTEAVVTGYYAIRFAYDRLGIKIGHYLGLQAIVQKGPWKGRTTNVTPGEVLEVLE